MKLLKTKWRWLVLPLVLCIVLLLACYSLLHWLIVIKWEVGINDNIVQAYIPIIIAFIVASKWMRPKIRALKLGKSKPRADIYYLIASTIIAAPTVFAQLYLAKASGELSIVPNVAHITKATKYYQLKEYYVDKQNAGEYFHSSFSGKYSSSRTHELFIALPIYNSIRDTATATTAYFLALKYSSVINENLSNGEKVFHYHRFFEQAYEQFRDTNVNRFSYLERLGHNGEIAENMMAVSKSPVRKPTKPVVFFARFGPFEERDRDMFGWIFKSFAIGLGLWLLMIAFPGINYNELYRKKQRF